MSRSDAVVVRHLVVSYGDAIAVDGATWSAAAGQVTVVVGPNGAGKTSTIETAEGLRQPAAGSVRVLGLDPIVDRALLAPRVGVQLQQGGVHPGLSAFEALRLDAAFHRSPLDPADLIERVGLVGRERRAFKQLSGGEQRRLTLALALVGRPEVVFLDEPTSGVDLDGRAVIRSIVGELTGGGVAVVLTTHELAEAEEMADRVVVMDHGRIVTSGTLEDVCGSSEAIRFRAPGGLPVGELALHLGLDPSRATEISPGHYEILVAPDPAAIAGVTAWAAARNLTVDDLRTGRRLLEHAVRALLTPSHG